MPPGAWVLLAIFGLAAVQSAAALALHRRGGAGESLFSTAEADATHLTMNAVMAVMVTPAYTPAVRHMALGVLAVTSAGVALALIRHRPGAPSPGPLSFGAYAVAAAYHVLMLGAMIYALAAMTPNLGAMCAAPMAGMNPAPAAPHRWLTATHALALLFALDAVTGSVAVLALPRQLLAVESAGPLASATPAGLDRQTRGLRLGFIPHLVMDAGMVWMLAMA